MSNLKRQKRCSKRSKMSNWKLSAESRHNPTSRSTNLYVGISCSISVVFRSKIRQRCSHCCRHWTLPRGPPFCLLLQMPPQRDRFPFSSSQNLANDGLCDYAYVIDLDKEVFEIYGEPCDKPPGHHRFEAADRDDSRVPSFMASLAFADLKSHLDNKTYLKAVNEQIEKSRKK